MLSDIVISNIAQLLVNRFKINSLPVDLEAIVIQFAELKYLDDPPESFDGVTINYYK